MDDRKAELLNKIEKVVELKTDIDISNTWSQVKDKPFTSIGTGLSVDGSGVLSAQGGQGGTSIYSAPFNDFLTAKISITDL